MAVALQPKYQQEPDTELTLRMVPRTDIPADRQLPALQRPWLRIPDRLSVADLKDYVVLKFPSLIRAHEVSGRCVFTVVACCG